MKLSLYIALLLLLNQTLFCQDLRIYHGEKSESVFLKQNDKLENSSRESIKIVRGSKGVVTIHILNPNPFFYNYKIETEDVEIKDDFEDQFAELVKLVNALPDFASNNSPLSNATTAASRENAAAVAARRPAIVVTKTKFDEYNDAIKTLYGEVKSVKTTIETSDKPETLEEALKKVSNSAGFGFRAAIAEIKKQSSVKCHFNSSTLEKDLNDMLDAAITDNSLDASFGLGGDPNLITLYKSAFKTLNSQIASAAKEIIKVTEKDRIMRFQVPVKENKQTNIKLVITKINNDDNVTRELISEEIATVVPLYVRKRFEVVPVVNLIFQSNRQKYSVENNIVKSSSDDDAKFNIGAMALVNFASFGEFKEYGVGLGIGYSVQPSGNASSFLAIPSLSYKSIFRIGFGFGFNLAPVGLKDGAKVDAALPANISNIDDVIDYKRKPAAVLTIAISGFKL